MSDPSAIRKIIGQDTLGALERGVRQAIQGGGDGALPQLLDLAKGYTQYVGGDVVERSAEFGAVVKRVADSIKTESNTMIRKTLPGPFPMSVTASTTLAEVREAMPDLTEEQAANWLAANRPGADVLTAGEVTKSVAYSIMKGRAEQERQPTDSPQQAMARFMKTSEGNRLYQVYKALPDDPEPEPIAKAAPPPAQRELIEKAAEVKKNFPGVSDAQARAHVYKANPGLMQRVQREVYYGDGPEAA